MKILLSLTKIKALEQKIYLRLLDHPDMGMGEMGECRDEADRIVREWMEENDIEEIETDEENERADLIDKMGNYLSVDDEEDYHLIIAALKRNLITNPDDLIDYIVYKHIPTENENELEEICIPVWDKLQDKFLVEEFCELVGIEADGTERPLLTAEKNPMGKGFKVFANGKHIGTFPNATTEAEAISFTEEEGNTSHFGHFEEPAASQELTADEMKAELLSITKKLEDLAQQLEDLKDDVSTEQEFNAVQGHIGNAINELTKLTA